MKKLLLFIPLLFIFSCSKVDVDNFIDPIKDENYKLEILNYNSLPQNIVDFNEGYRKSEFTEIKRDQVIKKIKTKNYISYTFVASAISSDPEKGFFFDNYVVFEKGKQVKANIYRYYPDLKWIKGDLNFESFSGSIEVFTQKGGYLGFIAMENGKQKMGSTASQKTLNKSSCELTAYDIGFICTALTHPDGTTYEICDPIYNYEWTCDSGSSNLDYGDGGDNGGIYDTGDSGGTGDGGGISSPSVPMNPDGSLIFNVDLHENFIANKKIHCTYQQLLKTTSLPTILMDFFGKDALFNLSFNVVKDLECKNNTDITGCTKELGEGEYRIDIDEDYINNPNTPTIFLAQTLVHEAIHANLFAAVKKMNNGISPIDTRFEALYEDYRKKKNLHHEIIAEEYTGIMKAVIKEVHPLLNDDRFITNYSTLGQSYWNWENFYEYVSYRGLHLTEAGKDYYQSHSADISKYEVGAEADSTVEPNCN